MTGSTNPSTQSLDVSASFERLSQSAARVNAASDDLSKAVAPIDAALKRLGLGLTVWHMYAGGQDQDGEFWEHRVGYTRIGRNWGLAISDVSGNSSYADSYENEEWLFNDAPRAMRAKAIDHIPPLLEKLVEQADKVATELNQKAQTARQIATTITEAKPTATGRR